MKWADETAKREEQAVHKSEILMMLLQNKSEEEIADKLKLPLEEIQKIVLKIREAM